MSESKHKQMSRVELLELIQDWEMHLEMGDYSGDSYAGHVIADMKAVLEGEN